MDKPSNDAPEHEQCRWWRENVMELTRDQLSVMTGFSVSSIKEFEVGRKEIDESAKKRYRMACAAAEFGIQGGWLNRSLSMSRSIRIELVKGDEEQ